MVDAKSDPTPPQPEPTLPTDAEVRESLAVYSAEQSESRWSSEAGMRAVLVADRLRRPAPLALDDAGVEALGRLVRRVWVDFARMQPNPKPHHLLPWEELDEPNKEVDRLIGRAVATAAIEAVLSMLRAELEDSARGVEGIEKVRRSLRIAPAVEAPKVPPGPCGEKIDGASGPLWCRLLHGHEGWHLDDCGASWGERHWMAPSKADVRAAVEADRAAVRSLLPMGPVRLHQYDAACRAVDAKTSDATPPGHVPPTAQSRGPSAGVAAQPNSGEARDSSRPAEAPKEPGASSVYRTPPVAVAPSVVEEAARILSDAGRSAVGLAPVEVVQDVQRAQARALLAHLAAKATSDEAVDAAIRSWRIDGGSTAAMLAAVARVVFGEVKAGHSDLVASRLALADETRRREGMAADLRAAREEVERLSEADSEIRAAWKALGAQDSELLLESAERVIRERDEAKQEVETLKANIAEIRGAGSTLTDEDCAHVACLYWGGQPKTHLPRNGMGSQAFNTARRASYDQRMRDVAVIQELAARFRSERPESGGAYEAGKLDGVNEALLDLVAGVVPSTPTGKNSYDSWHLTLASRVRAEAERDTAVKARDEARAERDGWEQRARHMEGVITKSHAVLDKAGAQIEGEGLPSRIETALRAAPVPAEVRRLVEAVRSYQDANPGGTFELTKCEVDCLRQISSLLPAAEAALVSPAAAPAGLSWGTWCKEHDETLVAVKDGETVIGYRCPVCSPTAAARVEVAEVPEVPTWMRDIATNGIPGEQVLAGAVEHLVALTEAVAAMRKGER